MFLVIVGHLPFILNFAISLFHMPLFFMLSGYLYKIRCVKEEFVRSFKCLIIPYIVFNCIIGIVHIFIFCENPCDILKYVVISEQEHLSYSFRAMWFLVSLFTMRIISSFAGKFSFLLSIILFVLCWLYKHIYGLEYIIYDPFQLTSTFLCYVFFELGRYIKDIKSIDFFKSLCHKIKTIDSRILLILYALIFIIAILYVRINHMREVNLFRSFYGDSILTFLVTSIIISLMYVHTSSIIFKRRNMVIEELSNGMIFILCSHQLIITLCNEMFKFNNITSVFFAFGFMCLSIYPIRFLRRYAPFVLGR